MKITDIQIQVITIPLIRTFKTALRSVDRVENIIITIHTDSRHIGFGSAAPATVITGETSASIVGAVEHIRDAVISMDISDSEAIFQRLNRCIIGNFSAKAAVDMALYDLMAKSLNVPLHRLLGGIVHDLETDITISLDTTDNMVAETKEKLSCSFTVLKVKVGGNPELDVQRLQAISQAIGSQARIRIDANQGWSAKEAIYVGNELARKGISIELMEQPVRASDFEGLRLVRNNVSFPVYADESIFSPQDALRLIGMGAVDGLNIKLMKCGGIYNGSQIAAIAEAAGIPCMIGSMMECSISVTAAAHLAASRAIIGRCDLDAPLFCSLNPASGGISYAGAKVLFSDSPGLGIETLTL